MNEFEKFEPVQQARFETQFSDGTEWVVARASRNWLIILFIGIWLIGWTAGGVAVVTKFLQGEAQLFLAVWLVGWLLGWVFAATWLGWQFSGRLQITAQGRALLYRWSMPLLSKERRYDVQQIRNLRAGGTIWPWGSGLMNVSYPPFLPGMPGSVQFDYGGRTVNVMPGLDQAEGQAIADWLGQRLS
jgi:hypothetical protein